MRTASRWSLVLVLLGVVGFSGAASAERAPSVARADAADAPAGAATSAELEVRPMQGEQDGQWIGNAICYGPHRDGQRPGEEEPTAAQLREDLDLMQPHWSMLRIYGASGFAETLLRVIREDGRPMRVLLGVWIGPDEPEANQREVDTAIRLAREYPDVVLAVSVSNETQVSWSPHPVPLDTLMAHLREVRAAVEQPVTVVDDHAWWLTPESRAVAVEIDFVTVHAHPMWNGITLDHALAWLQEEVAALKVRHPDRPLVLGETGWATSVHDDGEQGRLIQGEPGEEEQARFYRQVRQWADATRQPVFWFEAFDEKWKGGDHPAEVEKHWGLFHSNRTPKQAMGG